MAVEPTGVEARMDAGWKAGPSRVWFRFVHHLAKIRPFLFPVAAVFLLPLFFSVGYFFPDLLTRHAPLAFWKSVFAYGLTLAWVSLPYFSLAAFALARAFRAGVRGWVLVLAALSVWIAWVVLWNLLVYPSFGVRRSILPVALCTFLSVAFPLVRRFYLTSVRELEGGVAKEEEDGV